jgi:hypothetical protein
MKFLYSFPEEQNPTAEQYAALGALVAQKLGASLTKFTTPHSIWDLFIEFDEAIEPNGVALIDESMSEWIKGVI